MRGSRLSNRLACVAVAAGATLLAGPSALGGLVTHRLGEQDFAHGAGPVLVDDARSAGGNEAFPFDGTVFGDDRARKFGTVRFAYAFKPSAVPADGTLVLGLIGLDSAPGSPATVRLYLDGIEQPNDAFAGASSPLFRSSASVVSVPVDGDLLSDGALEVTVKAFRRSPGYPGNAIEADFSTLSLFDLSTPPGNGTGSGNGGGGTPGGGGVPGDGGAGGGTTDPDGGNNGNPNPGQGGNPGPVPGHGVGDGGSGGGGSANPPPHAVPLPPAALAGALGLAFAAAAGRRQKPR